MNRATWLAHAGSEADPMTGALVPPLHASTTFRRDDQYHLPTEFAYGRYAHPLAMQAERALATLDGGGSALVFNSGLSAMHAVIDRLPPGSSIAIPEVMYHGGRDLVLRAQELGRLVIHTFDSAKPASLTSLADEHDLAMVWVETIANPMWVTADIGTIASIAESAGARLVVDSTVTPPVAFRPLEHGADVVFHSATKYLNGHSDVTAGVLVGREDDPAFAEMGTVRTLAGSVLPPFETWLLLRGLRTLHVRFERACSNAAAIAEGLTEHPKVEQVLYPGLAGHPGHDVAARQFGGVFGAMLSVLVAGGAAEAIEVATRLQVIQPATSLGGVESLVEHRASVEGPNSPVPSNLLRLSIGIEHVDDLIADLEQALA